MNRRTILWTGLAVIGAVSINMAFNHLGTTAVSQSKGDSSSQDSEPEAAKSKRIISLFPPITETIYALKEERHLIGRSSYCNTPEEALSLQEYGTGLTPNLEEIAKAKPELIFIDGSSGNKAAQLKTLASVESLSWTSQSDALESIQTLGNLLNASQKADALTLKFKTTLEPQNASDSPRLLLVLAGDSLGKGPLWFLKDQSLHGDAIKAAGFNNAISNPIKGPPSLSIEKLFTVNPDLIIILATDNYTKEQAAKLPSQFDSLGPLAAVKNNRIGVLHGTKYVSTGPEFLELVPALRHEALRLLDKKDD